MGDASSRILKWSASAYHCLAKMNVEKDVKVASKTAVPEEALVWSVVKLSDDTIASGDSRGTVTIWDAHQCVVLQQFNAHQADVLAMTKIGDMLVID